MVTLAQVPKSQMGTWFPGPSNRMLDETINRPKRAAWVPCPLLAPPCTLQGSRFHYTQNMTIDERIEALTVSVVSLHSSASELHATAISHERQLEELTTQSRQDAENIRALVRIAEIRNRRLTQLKGDDTVQ